jgi:hypothetical protein
MKEGVLGFGSSGKKGRCQKAPTFLVEIGKSSGGIISTSDPNPETGSPCD